MISTTRRFGATGFDLTTVGFGAWATGGGGWSFGWGPQDDAASIAAIRHAVESGVNWIDTAAIYGLGHSEEVVAEALAPFSDADRPYVFTKCGLRWDETDPMKPAQRVGRPESIRWEVEQSLGRLKVEGIDLYQMHWPPEDGSPMEDYWGTLLELKAEGVVAAVGLSNHTVEQVAAAAEIGHVDSVQPPLSLITRDAAADLAPWCAEHHTGLIAYSPLQNGLLTGSFSRARVDALARDDWRKRSANFTGAALERNLALAEALRPVAERHGVTPAAVAVAWVLAWPGVTGAIVGARNPGQVDSWTVAAGLELTAEDLEELARALEATGAGSGPIRPGSGSAS